MAADLTLLALPGDGIGPEITAAARAVADAAAARVGVTIGWEERAIGFAALAAEGVTITDAVVEAAKAADGVLLGTVSHNDYPPVAEGGLNPSGVLRKALDLHANIRPARSHPALPAPIAKPVDLVIARENLEGFYADRNMHLGPGEFMPVEGVALATRRITTYASDRIARAAFALAAQRPNSRVTAVHKANVMRVSDGVFLDACRAVAAEQPAIPYDEVIVDAAAALMVRDPARFDVIVTTNMFGDILSDLAVELSGGLGLGASLNHGPDHAVAQAQHGSAPDIAGRGVANPASMIGSVAMLLAHLGHGRAARLIHTALDAAIADPATRTRDLGGMLGTDAFANAVIDRMDPR